MVAECRYGPVRVTQGRHTGKVGYYDDEGDRPGQAVVYFGVPFNSAYTIIWRKWLEPVDVTLRGLEKFKRDYPEIAVALGARTLGRNGTR